MSPLYVVELAQWLDGLATIAESKKFGSFGAMLGGLHPAPRESGWLGISVSLLGPS